MSRAEFLQFLTRLARDDFLTEREAGVLLRRFDRGEIDDALLPLPLAEAITDPTEDDARRALALLLAIGFLGHRLREVLQDRFIRRARALKLRSVREWQRAAKDLVTQNILQQAIAGSGKRAANLARFSAPIKRQLAYLSRTTDEISARLLMERALSEKAIGHRLAMNASAGREAWFRAHEADLGEGYVVDYESRDDDRTCSPCLDAELGSPYLPTEGPFPAGICLGRGFCRCRRVERFAPAEARQLRREAA